MAKPEPPPLLIGGVTTERRASRFPQDCQHLRTLDLFFLSPLSLPSAAQKSVRQPRLVLPSLRKIAVFGRKATSQAWPPLLTPPASRPRSPLFSPCGGCVFGASPLVPTMPHVATEKKKREKKKVSRSQGWLPRIRTEGAGGEMMQRGSVESRTRGDIPTPPERAAWM